MSSIDTTDEPTVEEVIRQLARESLATRDRLVAAGWVVTPMPRDAEVRAVLRTATPPVPGPEKP